MVRIAISPLLVGWLVTTQFAAAETELLCFASQHCPPCRRMQPIIEQLRSAGYPVRRIDVSRREHRHLALEYGIPRVPCFVMIHNGQEVARIEGATGYANLQALLNRVVPNNREVDVGTIIYHE